VQLLGRLVARIDTPEQVVALTFEDGPTAAKVDEEGYRFVTLSELFETER